MTKNKVGPPTKYHDDIPELLIQYFSEQRFFIIKDKEYPEFNSIEGFCAYIRISKSTFYLWLKMHEKLSDAFDIAKALQAQQIYNFGLNKIWSEGLTKLIATNCTDMREKVDNNQAIEQETNKLVINLDG